VTSPASGDPGLSETGELRLAAAPFVTALGYLHALHPKAQQSSDLYHQDIAPPELEIWNTVIRKWLHYNTENERNVGQTLQCLKNLTGAIYGVSILESHSDDVISDVSVYYADTDGLRAPSTSSASESYDHGMDYDSDKENSEHEKGHCEVDDKPDKISRANKKEIEDLSTLLNTFRWEELLQKVQGSDKLVQELRRLSEIKRGSVLMT